MEIISWDKCRIIGCVMDVFVDVRELQGVVFFFPPNVIWLR